MACLEGFEPPTYWFVASHSIQLSYKHIVVSFTTLIFYHFCGGLSTGFDKIVILHSFLVISPASLPILAE